MIKVLQAFKDRARITEHLCNKKTKALSREAWIWVLTLQTYDLGKHTQFPLPYTGGCLFRIHSVARNRSLTNSHIMEIRHLKYRRMEQTSGRTAFRDAKHVLKTFSILPQTLLITCLFILPHCRTMWFLWDGQSGYLASL